MATLDFPNNPIIGDLYPQPPVPGQPVYTWDGLKWTTFTLPIGGGMGLSNVPPLMNGTAAPGTSTVGSRDDHIHPSDSSRVAKGGDTMTGLLVLAADPSVALGAATKQYADGVISGALTGKVNRAGDTMTGPLLMAADPVASLGTATKQYVDGGLGGKIAKAGDTMIGALILSADPTAGFGAATKQYADSVGTSKVSKGGDTMTGPLLLNGDPSAVLGAATKQYVDNKVATGGGGGGGASVLIADTAPTAPDNSLWWESDTGILFIRYNDGTSTQWVTTYPAIDSSAYALNSTVVRYDISQSLTAPQQQQARQNIYAAPFDAMAYSGLQINGGMEVSQEVIAGTGIVASGYVCDGWIYNFSTTGTGPANVFSSGIPGTPFAIVAKTTTPQATITGTQTHSFFQPIEGYRCARLAWGTTSAQPITIGFWTAHTRTGIYSVSVRNNGDSRSYATTYTQNVSDAWEYKTVTISGDVSGTWAKDNTVGMRIQFANACGPTYTAPAANVWTAGTYVAAPGQVNGVAATTDNFRITGVTVLPGTQAPTAAQSPNVMRSFDQELLMCQRYYEKSYPYAVRPGTATGLGGAAIYYGASVPVTTTVGLGMQFIPKRAAPTLTSYGTTNGTAGTVWDNSQSGPWPATILAINERGGMITAQIASGTTYLLSAHWVADARL
jgi:hypothetical protein